MNAFPADFRLKMHAVPTVTQVMYKNILGQTAPERRRTPKNQYTSSNPTHDWVSLQNSKKVHFDRFCIVLKRKPLGIKQKAVKRHCRTGCSSRVRE
jgi:hypothetical protein